MTVARTIAAILLSAQLALAFLSHGFSVSNYRRTRLSLRSAIHHEGGTRVYAIGDIHGDIVRLVQCLRLAGLVADDLRWTGGQSYLVQVGDLLDRGADEFAVLALLSTLRKEARAQGGAVICLLGNHEVMNAMGDFRYTTVRGNATLHAALGSISRESAFTPGGPLALSLASFPVAAKIHDTLFVHGGMDYTFTRSLLPSMTRMDQKNDSLLLSTLNQRASNWLKGNSPQVPLEMLPHPKNALWNRELSRPDGALDGSTMASLEKTLTMLGVKRMVVGHTPQFVLGINSAADGRVWRIDTGMWDNRFGKCEVLEITTRQLRQQDDPSSRELGAAVTSTIRVITEDGIIDGSRRSSSNTAAIESMDAYS